MGIIQYKVTSLWGGYNDRRAADSKGGYNSSITRAPLPI